MRDRTSPVWVKKRFPTTWAATSVLDDFVQVFMGLGGPARMMLVEEAHTRLDTTLWISLPKDDVLDAFPGFVSGGTPPAGVTLLAGNKTSFAKLFGK
jgi:hypothetical protein